MICKKSGSRKARVFAMNMFQTEEYIALKKGMRLKLKKINLFHMLTPGTFCEV